MNTLSSDSREDTDQEFKKYVRVHVTNPEPVTRECVRVHVTRPEPEWKPAQPSMFALAMSEHRQRMVAVIGAYRRLENLAGTTPQRELIRGSLTLVEEGLQQLNLVSYPAQEAA